MIYFEAVENKFVFKKNDQKDPRLGDLIRTAETLKSTADLTKLLQDPAACLTVCIAGYPDDEGIRLNMGRPGASEAPNNIRAQLYRMTPSLLGASTPKVIDIGNLRFPGSALPDRHEFVRTMVSTTLSKGSQWIGLGGGHDYGFPDAAGFLDIYGEKKPLVINFDAHLDVRPPLNGYNSGTPYYRMLEEFSGKVDFLEVGIQAHCNSQTHLQWAKERGTRFLFLEEFLSQGIDFSSAVLKVLDDWALPRRKTFLSVDIDAFSNAYAMGASQSWCTGLEPNSFMACFNTLLKRFDVRGLGLYEVSPPLDQDQRTAKLAAQIIHRFLFPL